MKIKRKQQNLITLVCSIIFSTTLLLNYVIGVSDFILGLVIGLFIGICGALGLVGFNELRNIKKQDKNR
jgi:hypothetical protein